MLYELLYLDDCLACMNTQLEPILSQCRPNCFLLPKGT